MKKVFANVVVITFVTLLFTSLVAVFSGAMLGAHFQTEDHPENSISTYY